MLRALSPGELRDQLCGEEALEWPLEHLQEAVLPGAGYTRNSQVWAARRESVMSALSYCMWRVLRSGVGVFFALFFKFLPPGASASIYSGVCRDISNMIVCNSTSRVVSLSIAGSRL